MESLYLLIPVSVVLVFVIAGIFWWSVRSGQFDDLEGPAHRIIMDRDVRPPDPAEKSRKDPSMPD
jgi:cbb3-type cytochrome oxidase maturation protein